MIYGPDHLPKSIINSIIGKTKEFIRSNSSQMSTFKLQHFFMNDVPAYFGNAGI